MGALFPFIQLEISILSDYIYDRIDISFPKYDG